MSDQIAQEPKDADVWEDAVRRVFAELSELRVFWRDQERPAVLPNQPFVTLFVSSDDVVGVPETRLEKPAGAPAGEEIEPSIVELHLLSLEVAVESYDNRARRRGRFFASRIRTRLRRESAILDLQKVSTALVDVSPIISAAAPIDNRQTSLSTMTVRLHAATCERDRAFGFIDSVELEPELVDEAGSPIPLAPIVVDLPDP